ncbi:MAG: RlmE family RNA methyltransferase, partial [Thaumarchaeota archaeon]|nr:RlmE family RNA methyltransferase [Nitrososphaerota archaeon]
KAKEEGYRSRAAYKLMQLNHKYKIIKPGFSVVDIGAAPGGWLEVVSELVGPRGLGVGVDIVPVKPIGKNVKILEADVLSAEFPSQVLSSLGRGKADVVLADMSPKLSGVWDMDHFKQIELCQRVVDILPSLLGIGGSSVMKAFHGADLDSLTKRLKNSFERVEITKPDASRSESSEVYLVSLNFSGQVPSRSSEDLQKMPQSEPQSDSGECGWQSDRLN